MGRARKAEGGAGAPAWMATFADLMSLLLTFFILLLSFAEMDIVKFKDALGSINEAMGGTAGGFGQFDGSKAVVSFDTTPSPSAPPPTPTVTAAVKQNNTAISDELEQLVEEFQLEDDVEVKSTKRGVVMRVRGRMFFSPGTADLKPGSQPLLEKISSLLKRFPKKIAIEGHTDNIPIGGGRYSNNWELSTARAYSALKYLQEYEEVDVRKIHIAGFGDTHPLTTNDTPDGRAKNRRVEFVFQEE